MTRLRSAKISMTLPCLPRSPPRSWRRPEMTCTRSPFLMLAISDYLRCQRDDLHELLVAKLATDRSEDARAAGVPVTLEEHSGILIELDVGAVGSTGLLLGANDDRLDDLALLDVSARDGVFHGRDDNVAESRIATAGTTEHANREQLLGAGVIGDFDP